MLTPGRNIVNNQHRINIQIRLVEQGHQVGQKIKNMFSKNVRKPGIPDSGFEPVAVQDR
jgi:hypothetical protein